LCGIFGVVNRSGNKLVGTKRLVSEMALVGSVRGMDSTGMFTVTPKGDVEVYKRALHSHDYLQLRQSKIMIENLHSKEAVIGHNRAATMGSVTDDMAHPFTYGDITMVHNGTLKNHRMLHNDIPPFASDSEALCWAINHMGARAALEAVSGAFSIIWYDASEDTINLCRNDDRPMSMAMTTDGRLVLASESLMLKWMLDRDSLTVEGSVRYPVKGYILTFKLNEDTPYTAEEINLYTPPTPKIYTGYTKYDTKPTNNSHLTSNTSFNKKRADRVTDLLATTNHRLGDSIVFWGGDFTPYREGGSTGKIDGYDEYGEKDIRIVSHNIDIKETLQGDEKYTSNLYQGIVRSAATVDGDLVINVTKSRLIDIKVYYDEEAPGVIVYVNEMDIDEEFGTSCDICGGRILSKDPGFIPINEHVIGEKDKVCCISCAEVIRKQNSPEWDSLLITTVN